MDPDQHCLIDSNGTKFSAVFDNSSRLFPDARKALQDKNRRHVISDFDSLRIRSVVAELNGGTCSQSLEIGQTNRDKVLMVSALFKDRTNIKYDSKVQVRTNISKLSNCCVICKAEIDV